MAPRSARVSVLSLNAWGQRHLDQREAILRDCLTRFQPDLLCLQEADATVQSIAASTLSDHQLTDTSPGEVAILWCRERFDCLEQGKEALPQQIPSRPLVWARLRDKINNHSLTVATAHLTWPGHRIERETGTSPRLAQAEATASCLQAWQQHGPVIFTGDLNEAVHPRRILAKAGFVDALTRLGLPCEPTRPAPPWDTRPAEVCDWIMSSDELRPTAAFVARHQLKGLPASDHWPVFAEFVRT